VKKSCSKVGHVLRCPQTHGFTTFPTAKIEETKNGGVKYLPPRVPQLSDIPFCQSMAQGGPYWLSNLHNLDFIRRVKKRINNCDDKKWVTKVRLNGLLEACLEELPDVPFYYHVMKDFGIVLKFSLMKTQIFRSALINAGYR
jgi:tRNA G26 N,N-dimethylase Trm1